MVGGKAESVKLCRVDLDRWQRSGVTISVHNCSTDSEERYQILFDLTVVCYFDKRHLGYGRYGEELRKSRCAVVTGQREVSFPIVGPFEGFYLQARRSTSCREASHIVRNVIRCSRVYFVAHGS